MKSSSVLSLAALATSALAHPLERRANSTDIDVVVLQFALTLEHLENVFYKGAVSSFSAQDFSKAGYNTDYYNNLRYIASDEQNHVVALEGALKAVNVTPTAACTYNFPYSDVQGFVGLASVLEGLGTSAYLGGAPLITSKSYLSVAGSILVAEALHTSVQRAAAGEVAAANAYGTALDPTSVYTLAANFIVACPNTNPSLPFTPYPELVHSSPLPANNATAGVKPLAAGGCVSFTTKATVPSGAFVTFVSGLSVVSTAGTYSQPGFLTADIPAEAQGQTYAFITKSNVSGSLDQSQIVAGPAIIEVTPQTPSIDNSIL